MDFKVFSREGIEKFKTTEPHVVISITDPDSDPIIFHECPGRKSILHLQFHDVDSVQIPREQCTDCKGTGIKEEYKQFNNGTCYKCSAKNLKNLVRFTEKDASSILWYVAIYSQIVDLVLINCEAGRSRSVAIASALDKLYNQTDEYWFKRFTPNMFIYRTMIETFQKEKNYGSV